MKSETNLETGKVTEQEETAEGLAALAQVNSDLAWTALRETRNSLLAESDWTVLSDSPTSTAAWKTYRQALRDLPANTTDPTAPDWPTPPS